VIERGSILNSGPEFYVPELTANHPEFADPKGVATLKEVEQRHIILVLQKTGWKVRGPGGAAELLKMPPSTLETKIKKLGIKRPRNYRRKKNSKSKLGVGM
jgi:formate hydrogenlyase transcriptional activator